jgi:hypothetical protein
VNVDTLTTDQRSRVAAVPLLVLQNGAALSGSQAFEWLKQFESDVELDSYDVLQGASGSLGFASVDDTDGMLTYSTNFSAFEKI